MDRTYVLGPLGAPLGAALIVLACGGSELPPITPSNDAGPATSASSAKVAGTSSKRRFRVYKGDLLELEVANEPGMLVSNSAPPPLPNDPPQKPHPFLSAVAFVPQDEGHLRQLLDASKSIDEWFEKLRDEGYRIEEVTPP
jgi:hypothetical protein